LPSPFVLANIWCNGVTREITKWYAVFGLNLCAPQLTVIGVLVVECLFLSVAAGAQGSPILSNIGEWRLTWSDEFNGPNGSGVDSSKWAVEVGGKGGGNQELEYYTSRRENAHIQDGNPVIEAGRENYTGTDGVSQTTLQQNFFLLLNLAVGGDWPENPDTAAIFPQTMLVDYAGVYQRSSE
jgi:beta-glucanase (GH16 family)